MRRYDTLAGLHWCDRCNVPLIGRSCGKCGDEGREVPLAPPGDVRLALEGTKRKLRYLFLKEFGVQQLVQDVVVLNKTSGDDRAEEVIIDGRRVALLRYNLDRREHELVLRLDGARMLAAMDSHKQIVLRKTEGHLKGKHIPPEAIESIDRGIVAGDEVVIRMGDFIGCGSAKVDASALRSSSKGVKVREFAKVQPVMPRSRKIWTRILVRANQPQLVAKKAKAEHELKGAFSIAKTPVTVSFSGGKDSLVVLDLALSVTTDVAAIFIDTGLEHPLTREYVDRYLGQRGVRLLKAHAGNAFDDNLPSFGPPAKDFRWCCKVCKLGPVSSLIEERFPEGTMTVEGNRRLESFARGHTALIEENPFVPGQITINPIRDWTALEVWLYIAWRNLAYNPLYEEDIERVGCWMCPSALASEAEEISRISPELARGWELRLEEWAEANGLPKEYVTHGFWRWKQLPPKMKELAQRLGVMVGPVRADTLDLKVLKGVSPCTAGGYSVDGVLMTAGTPTLRSIGEMLKVVDDVDLSEEFGVARVDSDGGRLRIFAGGQISAAAETPATAKELFEKGARAVLRASLCTQCGICERTCRQGAVSLDPELTVDTDKCTRCGECVDSCVVAHYFDKLSSGLDGPRKPKKRNRGRR